jgi:hypothetical protein
MSYPLFRYELRYVRSPVVPGLTETDAPPLTNNPLDEII